MGILLLVIGAILMFIGGIWLLIEQFKESVLWGLGSIFVPFVALVFVIMHWDVSKRPFLIQVAGIVLLVIGAALSGDSTPRQV
jgi:hypothetical protein